MKYTCNAIGKSNVHTSELCKIKQNKCMRGRGVVTVHFSKCDNNTLAGSGNFSYNAYIIVKGKHNEAMHKSYRYEAVYTVNIN